MRRQYSFRALRDACPCANCREKRTEKPKNPLELPVLTTALDFPEVLCTP